MATKGNNQKTVFQRLTDVVIGAGNGSMNNIGSTRNVAVYNMPQRRQNGDDVLYTFSSKEARDQKLMQMKQQKLLAYQWRKTGYDSMVEQKAGATQVKVMYRDCDLMDTWPEIGAALDVISEETCTLSPKGEMLKIYSDSPRVKSILEDLFNNRLDVNVMLPMVVRSTCKYGNEFMLMNIDEQEGVMGWRELPVHEVDRVEMGMENGYGGAAMYAYQVGKLKPDEVKFLWQGHNEGLSFKNWQVAHFRLIKDSLYLPYGVSVLNKARRHWRILSMMEDAMLMYRLERSIERRVFKVNVGLIDDADVPAFLQEFMNGVKRAPIIDPQTGQVDLRKNFLDVNADYVIPVRNGQDPSSIEPLAAVQNQTSMDDINYIENKILAALKVPKGFLNFQESQGKGQNLSALDIRFNRMINSIQQAILMELNKIAIIHLNLLGFGDELTNFTLAMNNPSNQIEAMELDNLTKKITAASSALAEQGCGIPVMSWHQVQKEIMGRTDSEISDMLNEIRLESALAIELQRTAEIIKKTGLFDQVDRVYGEPGAKYNPNGAPGNDEGGLGGGGGPIGGGPVGGFGDDLGDIGGPGDDMGDIGGEEGGSDLGGLSLDDAGTDGGTNENVFDTSNRRVITENFEKAVGKMQFFDAYMNRLSKQEDMPRRSTLYDKAFIINENFNNIVKSLKERNEITEEIVRDADKEIASEYLDTDSEETSEGDE